MSSLKFEKKDYLNFNELNSIAGFCLPNQKAGIIANKLNQHIIIKENILYTFDKVNIVYQQKRADIKKLLIGNTAVLIEESFKHLTSDEKDRIKEHEHWSRMFDKASIDKYVIQLEMQLTKDEIEFDNYKKQLHFKNGYIDVSTGLFNKRTKDMFITKYIQGYEYHPSTKEQRNQVRIILNKIFQNNKEDRDCILSYLGSGLSGEGIKDQDLLFLLGKGSSGKSFIMLLTKEALEFYFVELPSDAFKMGNNNKDKILNTFLKNVHVLITWINELSHDKIDGDLFKKFAEGSLQSVSLYQDGSNDFKHYSKPVATTQRIPNLNVDTGVIRRLLGYEHKSKFTDIEDEVDEKKHIYKKVKDLHLEMKENGLICAWLDLLLISCREYLKGKGIKYTDHFSEAKEEIVDTNDTIQDFIDGKLIKTGEDSDRIGKDKMRQEYLAMYKDKMINPTNLISLIKEKGITYKSDYRVNNIKGCFVGVKLKKESDELEEEKYQNMFINQDDKAEYVRMEEFTKLQEQINKLMKQFDKKDDQQSVNTDNNEKKPRKKSNNPTINMLDKLIDQTEIL